MGYGEPLTERELQVLRGMRDNQTNQQIASDLNLSALTVKSHGQRLRTKLGARSRQSAALLGSHLI